MMSKCFSLAALAAATLLISGTANAAIIAGYVDGVSTDDSMPALVIAANASSTSAANTADPNNPVRTSFGAVNFDGTNWIYGNNSGGTSHVDPAAGAAEASLNYGWTVTADPGFMLDLSSLSFEWGWGANSALTTDFGYRAYAQIDGGSWMDLGSDSVASAALAAGDQGLGADANLPLSGQTADGGSVTFRIVPFATDDSGASVNAFRDINLNGTVVAAVPEPSSLGLLGLVSLAGVIRRRS